MAKAWLSILGLVEYDPSIFDALTFPTQYGDPDDPSEIDAGVIYDRIIAVCAELPLVYTQPAAMKELIRIWSQTKYSAFERILQALTENYNPIHNYDRHEEWDDDGSSTAQVMGYNTSTFTDANKVVSGNKRKGRAYGNIGVTTSAQMIEGEISMRLAASYADIIAESFKSEFCIMVY